MARDEVFPAPAAVDLPRALRPTRLARLVHFDELLLLAMRRFHTPSRTGVARALTRAGDAGSWTAIGLALLLGGWLAGLPAALHAGLRLASGALLATAASQLLKRRLLRPRPSRAIEGFRPLADNPDAFSFPSGHTAAAFAVAAALAGEPALLGPAALSLAFGIGLSRVYLGAHYPLDVAAGTALGSACGLLARLLVP